MMNAIIRLAATLLRANHSIMLFKTVPVPNTRYCKWLHSLGLCASTSDDGSALAGAAR